MNKVYSEKTITLHNFFLFREQLLITIYFMENPHWDHRHWKQTISMGDKIQPCCWYSTLWSKPLKALLIKTKTKNFYDDLNTITVGLKKINTEIMKTNKKTKTSSWNLLVFVCFEWMWARFVCRSGWVQCLYEEHCSENRFLFGFLVFTCQ